MDTYRDIEMLFHDYFADDVEPVLRYASLGKPATEKQPEPARRHVTAKEDNDGDKD